jgi:hypothetical protein
MIGNLVLAHTDPAGCASPSRCIVALLDDSKQSDFARCRRPESPGIGEAVVRDEL